MSQCNICKKPGHFAKMRRLQIPPIPKNRGHFQRQNQQTRNVKNINEEEEEKIAPPLEEEEESETNDPEPTMYITEDWNKINYIEKEFKEIKNHDLNSTTQQGEIIIQTTIKDNNKINWLADTGSPRSFVDITTTNELLQNNKHMILEPYNGQMKFKCFNNQDIPILGQLQTQLQSGSWTARNCNILVVKQRSQNLMGRDVLTRLGLTLTQQQSEGKKVFNITKHYKMDS